MESCSDSMYCSSPEMTTACTSKSSFLWGATQFPDFPVTVWMKKWLALILLFSVDGTE